MGQKKIIILLLLGIILLSIIFIPGYLKIKRLSRRNRNLERQIEEITQTNRKLEEEIDSLHLWKQSLR